MVYLRRKRIALFAAFVLLLAAVLGGCRKAPKPVENPFQRTRTCFQADGDDPTEGLCLVVTVETDRTVYSQNNLVYVSVTIYNMSDFPVTLRRGAEDPFFSRVRLACGDAELVSADFYWANAPAGPETVTLPARNKLVETVRMTAARTSEYRGHAVVIQDKRPAGEYLGTVTLEAELPGRTATCESHFQITITDEEQCIGYWPEPETEWVTLKP